MSDLRWHPLLRQWVAVTAHRQGRPQMPRDWCPFCPRPGGMEAYDVALYPNDFPAFSLDSEPFIADQPAEPDGFYRRTGAQGACDVVLYSPDHHLRPSELPVAQWEKVIRLWTRRFQELAAIPDVRHILIFENTGEAIGVTMPHPHGQIYSFPFVPPLVEREIESARDHRQQTGECLYCRILREEQKAGVRLVAGNESFVAFIPYFARFPQELHIYSRRHIPTLAGMTDAEHGHLAEMISLVRRKYDNLFGFPMPLMMLLRQNLDAESHFHIEFDPIQRSETKLKYLAGVESGAGTFLNDTIAEERADRLRRTEPLAEPPQSLE